MAEADKVYTREEIINMLADFTDGLSDDVKAAIPAETMGTIENISNGVNQAFDRIDKLNETIANLNKSNEDYRAKIAEYAADQADRMRQSIVNPEEENPAIEVLDKLKEDE